MKTAIAMLAVITVATSARAEERSGCTNETIRGTYGFSVVGTLRGVGGAPDQLLVGVATTEFDGAGNLTQVDNIHLSLGGVFNDRPGFGTYQLNADCSGTMTISRPPAPMLTLRIVVVDNGNEIRTAVMDPPTNLVTSNGRRNATRR
jgi:hypothetical protein